MSSAVFTVRRRDLAWATALIVLLSAVWVARGDVADAGAEPPGEGIAVVYVVSGGGFADALGVGPGAGADGAPIILVSTIPPLDSATIAELTRLDPRTVIIVGGLAVVSQATQDAIVALLPNAVVSRISGTNRYKTNAAFSAATFPIEGWISVPAGAFTTLNPDADVATIGNNLAYNVTTGFLRAPIHLPQGAEILELQIHAYDNSGALLTVSLDRYDASAGGLVLMSLSTPGAGTPGDTTVATTVVGGVDTEIVDNQNYAYGISVSGANSTSLLIRNVQVRYRLGASTG